MQKNNGSMLGGNHFHPASPVNFHPTSLRKNTALISDYPKYTTTSYLTSQWRIVPAQNRLVVVATVWYRMGHDRVVKTLATTVGVGVFQKFCGPRFNTGIEPHEAIRS